MPWKFSPGKVGRDCVGVMKIIIVAAVNGDRAGLYPALPSARETLPPCVVPAPMMRVGPGISVCEKWSVGR